MEDPKIVFFGLRNLCLKTVMKVFPLRIRKLRQENLRLGRHTDVLNVVRVEQFGPIYQRVKCTQFCIFTSLFSF